MPKYAQKLLTLAHVANSAEQNRSPHPLRSRLDRSHSHPQLPLPRRDFLLHFATSKVRQYLYSQSLVQNSHRVSQLFLQMDRGSQPRDRSNQSHAHSLHLDVLVCPYAQAARRGSLDARSLLDPPSFQGNPCGH